MSVPAGPSAAGSPTPRDEEAQALVDSVVLFTKRCLETWMPGDGHTKDGYFVIRQERLAALDRVSERVAALLSEREAAREALRDLLDVAERIRGGDSSLDPEEWYARRDYARVTLARFDASRAGEPG